jgi:hypothetical protein
MKKLTVILVAVLLSAHMAASVIDTHLVARLAG